MKSFHLLPAILFGSVLAAPAFAETSQFDGRWVSLACEMRPQQGQNGLEPWYLKRDITISEGTIQAVFHSFADRDCAMPLFDLEFAGQFNDIGDSAVAPGARQVDLVIDQSVKLTPQMAGFADFLNSGGEGSCGLAAFTPGLQQEVRETGCAAIGLPANAVTTEYEAMLVKGDALFFGARPVDGSSPNTADLRPTALQVPLFRQ
jgi:hypothetical protein